MSSFYPNKNDISRPEKQTEKEKEKENEIQIRNAQQLHSPHLFPWALPIETVDGPYIHVKPKVYITYIFWNTRSADPELKKDF